MSAFVPATEDVPRGCDRGNHRSWHAADLEVVANRAAPVTSSTEESWTVLTSKQLGKTLIATNKMVAQGKSSV